MPNYKKFKWISVILPFILFLFLLIYSFQSRHTMTELYAGTSYYIIFLLCIVWLFQFIRFLNHLDFSLMKWVKTCLPGIMVSLILTVMVFTAVPVKFKILNDETNLLAVSQSMLYHKEAYRITMAKYYFGNLHPVEVAVPNRPLLFPFVTHLVHSVLGYHYQNVFILNFLIMFFFLTGVYIAGQKTTDTYSALAAVILVLTYPVFTIYGTSGGYDLFSTLFFAIVMTVLYRFLKSPNPEGFAFLWISLLMFSNIRYESCIFFFIILIASTQYIKLEYFKSHTYVFTLTPILSLPFIWQRLLSIGTYENPQDAALFSIQSFLKHGKILIENFLNLPLDLPYAGLLNIAALGIIGYLIKQILTKKLVLKPYQIYFGCIFAGCLVMMLVIVLSHHLGRFDLPTQARLFMYFCVFASLTPIFLKNLMPAWITGKKLLIASTVLFLFYNPIAVEHRFINRLLTTRLHHQSRSYIDALDDRNVLIITPYAGQFTAMNYGAVNFNYANQNTDTLMDELQKDLYSKIIVIQEIDSSTQMPKGNNQRLDPAFKLKTLHQIQVIKGVYLRFSSVVI
jgi:hypothetical protein